MDLEQKARAAILAHGLLEPGQGVVAAVSGGADSVALLLCLSALAPELGFRLYAAHLHHGIRTAADGDLEFVERLCARLGVALHTGRADVPELAKETGLGLEAAGREARYAFLEEARARFGAARVAVAHHGDDQAETVLLHLLRGSGLKGLCGMQYKRGPVIRPLLGAGRGEIEAYLKGRNQPWRTDETNLSPAAGARNRIRLEIMPCVEAHINPGARAALCRAAALLQADEAYLCGQAREALEAARLPRGYSREKLAALPPALRGRALGLALTEAGAGQDVERRHIEGLEALLGAKTGAHLDLPGMGADIVYEAVVFSPAAPAAMAFCAPLALAGATRTPLGEFYAAPYAGPLILDPGVAIMDADKLPPGLAARPRRPGDTFFPLGAPGRKKLKAFFIDKKVPRPLREGPILFSGSEAVFVPGYGIAETVKVDAATRRMLRVDYKPNSERLGR